MCRTPAPNQLVGGEGKQQPLGPGRELESGEERVAVTARPALLGESVCDRERRVCCAERPASASALL